MSKKYEERVQDLLKKMTVEEKVGQLQQCGPSIVGAFEVSFGELLDMMFDGRISEEEFGRLMAGATLRISMKKPYALVKLVLIMVLKMQQLQISYRRLQ